MSNPKQKTILLVEDEAILLVAQAKTIKQFGFKVITANTGEKAVKLTVESNDINLILMDIDLGKGIDGPEAARQILSKQTIPIVFITSHSEKEYVDRVKEIIHYGYMIKNSGDFVLQSTIKMALELFEAHVIMKKRNQELTAANQKLCEKEEEYSLLLETALAGSFIAQDNKLAIVNPAAAEIIGHPVDDLTSKPFTTFIHPDEVGTVVDRYTRRLQGETIETNYPFRIVTADERVKWVNITSAPTSWNGRAATLNYIIDITEQKRFEEALHKERDFSASLVESSPAFFVAINNDGTVRMMNKSMLYALGYTLEEVTGKDYLAIFTSEADRELLKPVFSRLVNRNQSTIIENWILTKDGSTLLVEWHGRSITKPDGTSDYFFGVGTNITERKQAEKTLRKSEARFRRLHETMMDAFSLIDMMGNILEVNQSYINMLGYSMEELQRLSYFDLTPDKWHSIESKIVNEQIMVRGFSDVYEKEYIRKDGTIFPVELRTFLMSDDEGEPIGLWAIVRDITDRKHMEKELRKHHDKLEGLVKKRTVELERINKELKKEIAERKIIESELSAKSGSLEELNVALKVLLRQVQSDRENLEQRLVSNVKNLVLPYLEKINKNRLDEQQRSYLGIMETNLNEIVSPFLHNIQQLNLTPRETQVANLAKDGKSTKEIAEVLGVGKSAIDSYRESIRDKLNLTGQKVNLQSYLQTLK